MARRYRDGETMAALANEYGLSEMGVSHALKSIGVKPRHKGRPARRPIVRRIVPELPRNLRGDNGHLRLLLNYGACNGGLPNMTAHDCVRKLLEMPR